MGRVIRMRSDLHRDVQDLLPWYAAGRLDPAEHAGVEAHLDGCAECQAELRAEHGLAAGLKASPDAPDTPVFDVEQGWRTLRRLMQDDAPAKGPLAAAVASFGAWGRRAAVGWRSGGPWLGWVLVAQSCLLLILGGVIWRDAAQPARYRTLGAAPVPAAGNMVVIFGPDTPEAQMRRILRTDHARLVDGPTAADAYVIHVPAAERAAALARLRGEAGVVLAEPIDAGAPE
jgi:hypothetical protein